MTDVADSRPGYNRIYEELVDDQETDEELLAGMIAYGIYKESKREWAAALRQREGRKPNEAELEAYIQTWTESRLEGIRHQAAQTLASYAEAVVDQLKPEIREAAISGRIRADLMEFKAASKLTPKRIAQGLALSIAGAAFWTLFLVLLAVALRFAGVDLFSITETVSSTS